MTSASSLAASCRCRLTLLQSVEAATTSCINCDRLFDSCRLDYCNSLFFGISSVLRQLHWLPVHQHIDFLRLPHLFIGRCMVILSLYGNSASYLADDYRLVADAREQRLHSTESWTCVVTRTHSTFGDRAFAAASPGLWNSLQPQIKKSCGVGNDTTGQGVADFLIGYLQ